MRILLVDDFADNREVYATYFQLEGFDVDVAEDGEVALARVDAVTPDVIVMDLAMPKVDGWEATRLLKTNPRTRSIPIVVLTGLQDELPIARARAAGPTASAASRASRASFASESRRHSVKEFRPARSNDGRLRMV